MAEYVGGASATEEFLDRWRTPGLLIACPPTLAQLQGGVASVNRLLKSLREAPEATRVPTVVEQYPAGER